MDHATTTPAGGEAADSRYRAPALDKGLDILEVLAEQPAALTRSEIVRRMGRSPSEIYRMLERLVARGYVARIGGSDRYALTMKLFVLAQAHPPFRRLVAQAQPLMDAFADATRQSCHLVLPEAGAGIVVAQASPQENWEFRVRLGAELDLFRTGSGLTLLAFQRPERLGETLAIWGIADAGARLAPLTAHLDQIRRAGFRQAPSGQLKGIVDLSVPVLGPDGDALAALTCAYVEHPGDSGVQTRDAVLAQLCQLARALSFDGSPVRDG